MSVQHPPWLKRTRPCPFFSQGRCLFADSCNFLHDIKVKSALSQPPLSTSQLKPRPVLPKPVFDPPSVVVDSASPRSDNSPSPESLASPIQDSSRYSGLLSVLSDVIGPPSAEDAARASPTSLQSTTRISTDFTSESNSVTSGFDVTGDVVHTETGYSDPSAVLSFDSKATLVNPSESQTKPQAEPHSSEVDDEAVAAFLPVHDDTESVVEDTISYFVDNAEIYAIGSECSSDDASDRGEENITVVVSNRQSTLSSCTGASLLSSPRNHVFERLRSTEGSTADLLSPVELSAKLRPFPIPSFSSRAKRGDSIDSGYADGANWVGPLPFPRSPPRNICSPVTFHCHSRQASHSLLAPRDSKVSCDVDAVRLSCHDPIKGIREVESDGCSKHGLEDEDAAHIILDAYDTLASEERGENADDDRLQVNLTEHNVKDMPSKIPVVILSPRQHSLEHIHPAEECDVDSCNQLWLVSDDNLSFKTALTTQPSCEDLSDVSRVSSDKRDPFLSSVSGCSTPDTSHRSDANVHRSSSSVTMGLESQIDNTGVLETEASDTKSSLPEKSDADSNMVFTSGNDEHSPENIITMQEPLPGVFNRRSPAPSALVGTSPDFSSAKDGLAHVSPFADNTWESSSQERVFGVSQSDKIPPSLSTSVHSLLFKDASSPACLDANDPHESCSQNVAILPEHSPSVLHCSSLSPKSNSSRESTSSFTPAATGDIRVPKQVRSPGCSFHVSCFNERSTRPCASAESSHSPSVVENVLGCGTQDAGGKHNTPPANVGTHQGDRSNLDLGHAPPGVESGELGCPEVLVGQSPLIEVRSRSSTVVGRHDSECENFTQQLSFPLPPPFLSAEFAGHPSLSEGSSVLSNASVADFGGHGSKTWTVSQQEEVQQLFSGADLTEKMRPGQLPPFKSPDLDDDFTSRRSRAVSDLTVKGKSSPVTIHEGSSPTSKSPSPPLALVDPANSFYDQYIDDGTPDGISWPTHKAALPLDVSNILEGPLRPQHRWDLAFQTGPSPCSNVERSNSGTDSPRSETALRPLLTGRRSFLSSSLAEPVPNRPGSIKVASSARPSTRLRAREVGSTMVPLGFRRHKPRPALPTQSSRTSLPLDAASQLREALRIRTDMSYEDLPQGASSATHGSFPMRSPLPAQSMSAPPTGGLKQLRLSSVIHKRSSILSTHSSSIATSILSYHLFNSSTPQSPSVSSTTSFSRNSLLSSPCKQIPEQTHHTLQRSRSSSPVLQATNDTCFAPQLLSTHHELRSVSAPVRRSKSWRLSHYRAGSRNYTPVDDTRQRSRRTSILSLSYSVDEEEEVDEGGRTISQLDQSNHTDGWACPAPVLARPVHAIATPKPTLLFAIASDDVDQVRQVLESGDAGPNDSVGPQSALAFTLTNDKLTHKPEIVKALLAYGANPSALQNPTLNPAPRAHGINEPSAPPPETTLEGMDPATRYFVARADAIHTRQTSQLIYRSFFRPLTRVRYDVIGQDWALEQLFRVLSMHSQKLAVAPIVVLLCGPSGHGKSLLARKFGFLLDVPTHTVNMTTLQSAHDIWQSYSMSPYEEPSLCTLAEFLIENEGKRCVVVLDEIEKVEDQKALWSLLMPWELGRCSLEAGKRHVDARNVIWLATSNVGHELVFEYHDKRAEPDNRMTRDDYLELTALLRPCVSHCLGASLVSRVTTVLPFVPFTLDEKKAIAAEAVYTFAGKASKISPQEVESLVMMALSDYHPSEGARSLHRAVSNILMDMA